MTARVLAAVLAAGVAAAEDPAAIVRRSLDHVAFRTGGAEMQVRMVLENKRGEKRDRRLYVKSRAEGGLARSWVNFLSPADVAGTRFLLIENKGRDDDQFLWLPALRRVRRISGGQKNQSFMGSDFSYADLEGRDIEEASYRLKGEEAACVPSDGVRHPGKPCWVIEATPQKGAGSPYARLETWNRQDNGVGVRTRFYGAGRKLVKTLSVSRIETVEGKIVITESRMEAADKSHATTFVIEKIDFRDDIPVSDFTVQKLEQG